MPEENTKNALKSLWTAILHAANSPSQSALVTLLRGLKTAPEPSDSTKLWSSLSLFNETAREHWARTWQSATGAEWTNLNSFLARVSKEKIATGLEDLGVSNISSALEVRQEAGDRLDALLAAAGVWMVVMGEEIWGFLLTSSESESERADVYERWQFWKRRFLFMSHRVDLSVDSRELVAEAEAVMQRAA